jgi:hypothetical protein
LVFHFFKNGDWLCEDTIGSGLVPHLLACSRLGCSADFQNAYGLLSACVERSLSLLVALLTG